MLVSGAQDPVQSLYMRQKQGSAPWYLITQILYRSCRVSNRRNQLLQLFVRPLWWSLWDTALDFLWISLSGRPTSCLTTSHSCRKILISQSLHDLTERPAITEKCDVCILYQTRAHLCILYQTHAHLCFGESLLQSPERLCSMVLLEIRNPVVESGILNVPLSTFFKKVSLKI